MAAATDARVIYFSQDAQNHVLKAHLAEGGQGVFVENGAIVLATGPDKIELVELERIPFTLAGKIDFQVMNALAATAAAWAAGLNPAMIVRALTTFETDATRVPGRFNFFELNGVEVILDYGHNTAAMKALGKAVEALEPRHTVMVLTLPGDRRDEDVIETSKATIPFVDAYVLYDSEDRRGRADQEIPDLMYRQLPSDIPYDFADGQREGILKGWRCAQPGDRLIIICDEVEEALEILHDLAESVTADATCHSPLVLEPAGRPYREASPIPALTHTTR
jgi:cyanophycin synthetase